MEKLNQEMEEYVRQRTAELQAIKAELESCIYTIAHELQTPLITVQGCAAALQEDYADALNEEGQEYLTYIQQSIVRMDKFIQDLLEWVQAGQMIYVCKPVSMQNVLATALEQLQPQLDAKHICVILRKNLPTVYGDDRRLMQVWMNLLTNAIKYMGGNKIPQIEIGWTEQKQCYQFYVKDNGIGIAPKSKEKIFDLFQTLHECDEIKSTGIGLTIVKCIVERHGGRVWLESQTGHGSTFYFTIPKRTATGSRKVE